MKAQLSIFFLVIIISINYLNAQVSPIVTSLDGDYTLYKSNNYDQYINIINQQPYDLRQKISTSLIKGEYIPNSFNSAFMKNSINDFNFTTLKNNKVRIKILYIIDNDGNTYSCAFRIKTASINSLSNYEIETILTNAMQHKFYLRDIPNGVSSFYHILSVTYLMN